MQLNAPLDMHLHLRDAEMLENIAKASAQTFAGALIMPNLVPPVSTKEEVIAYKERIIKAIGNEKFTPYMTLFFKPSYDKAFLTSVRDEITAIKLYPAGITTNSEGGVSGFDVDELRPTLEAMSELNIPLCVHGETNDFVMDREAEFVSIYERLANAKQLSEKLYEEPPKRMIVLSNNGWFYTSIEPTLQKLLLLLIADSNKYGTTIYHAVNMSESYLIPPSKDLVL